ncbi:hypothetical protein HAX54_041990 [Datura stramonium]|uniref:Uncharacterized protein n=1 Tax=Datura stramonium TaxID=4076 RepID=A0ABS8W1Q9_DATST|nr:hypothetical protein [Datura stramonium]
MPGIAPTCAWTSSEIWVLAYHASHLTKFSCCKPRGHIGSCCFLSSGSSGAPREFRNGEEEVMIVRQAICPDVGGVMKILKTLALDSIMPQVSKEDVPQYSFLSRFEDEESSDFSDGSNEASN